ncbi:unnamed protein product [Pleuronectes platessa]|uniref:Sleeping Beauty transposase HTH domain-containing protein n=1 Tax=Pleuronectes platessa TaxID=8262 RepID=A0A9N7VYF5_PLEPL|nr:unnamed protein product [Pleuronectes platessa]
MVKTKELSEDIRRAIIIIHKTSKGYKAISKDLSTLKITSPAGEQGSFDDPVKAKHYIETNLRPREMEGE